MADQERTEEARPRQIEEAREKGMIPTSMELNTAFVVLFGFLALRLMGGFMLRELEALTTDLWSQAAHPTLTLGQLRGDFILLLLRCTTILGPLVFLLMLVGIAVGFAQVGPLMSFRIITPDLAWLDPVKGFQQLFSRRGLVETLKSILKMLLIGTIAFLTIRSEARGINTRLILDPGELLSYAAQVAFTIGWRVALAMLVIAGLDYAYQRWQHKQDMKITPQEAKQADKEMDMDPHVRQMLRGKAMEMATRRMMQEVPKADVVIVNPEHVAVALRYEPGVMPAPTVVAKGVDRVALKIKEIAREHHVPIVEDRPLAWVLYETVELGEWIPVELHMAVAAILGRIYRERMLAGEPTPLTR